MNAFDEATKKFTHSLCKAADWKHGYYGAAYSTRLEQAIKEARVACDEMEKVIAADAARLT
jgi:hypothetical protein